MKKQPEYARTTITVPPDLKARMDAVEESVNWSYVASQAFERHLLEMEAKKMGTTKAEVMKRLKASEELEAKQNLEDGRKAGKAWAEESASVGDLRRFKRNEPSGGWAVWFREWILVDGNSWPNAIFMHIDGEKVWDDEHTFWMEAVGEDDLDRLEDSDFALGFIEGALEVLDDYEKSKH